MRLYCQAEVLFIKRSLFGVKNLDPGSFNLSRRTACSNVEISYAVHEGLQNWHLACVSQTPKDFGPEKLFYIHKMQLLTVLKAKTFLVF